MNTKIILFLKWFKLGFVSWIMIAPGSRPRRVIKQKLISLKNYIIARPMLKYKIMKILNYFPRLKYKLKNVDSSSINIADRNIQINIENLSPKARKIYEALVLKQRKALK